MLLPLLVLAQISGLAEGLRILVAPIGKLLLTHGPARNRDSMLPGAGSCATSEESKETSQEVATYYNPAYRPALEEELSSNDVKHAALSFRWRPT